MYASIWHIVVELTAWHLTVTALLLFITMIMLLQLIFFINIALLRQVKCENYKRLLKKNLIPQDPHFE